MSGSFPISSSAFSTMGIKSIQNTIVSKTQSGKHLSRQIDGQRFAFTAKIITAKRSDVYGELMAFIIKQRSQKEHFTIIPPELEDARGVETGTLAVVGSHTAGDTTIAIDGFASDTANRLRTGDFIKFNGHTKIYMVVEDVTSSSGAATVTIEPPLRTALTNNSSVTYDSVPFTVQLTSDVQEFSTNQNDSDGNLLLSYEFDVIESL